MRKLLTSALAFTLAVSSLAGCAKKTAAVESVEETQTTAAATEAAETEAETQNPDAIAPMAEPVDINVLAMKGPTAMGMVEMMDLVDQGQITSNNYHFEIVAAVDEVAPKIAKGEADIAAVPANLGAVLYNNTEGSVQVLAINTLGVLYICETGDSVKAVKDLKGKTIYASGKGATPEYALNYILDQNGIDPAKDVTIEWKSEHAECVAAIAQDSDAIALLPQPFVTAAQMKNDKIRTAIDLTEAWDQIQNKDNDSSLLTGTVIVRTAFAKEHPEAVRDFLDKYSESVAYVQNHTEESAKLIGGYDIIAEEVAKKALPACNIVYIDGNEMKAALAGYLEVLYLQNPKSVGGKLPGNDFYYEAN